MPRRELTFSGYQAVWLFTMFDLPVKTKTDKRNYVRFRNLLLDCGFSQLQYSVYARFCVSEVVAETQRRNLERKLPDAGYVRFLSVTDRQFAKMVSFHGKTPADVESKPSQLMLF